MTANTLVTKGNNYYICIGKLIILHNKYQVVVLFYFIFLGVGGGGSRNKYNPRPSFNVIYCTDRTCV